MIIIVCVGMCLGDVVYFDFNGFVSKVFNLGLLLF